MLYIIWLMLMPNGGLASLRDPEMLHSLSTTTLEDDLEISRDCPFARSKRDAADTVERYRKFCNTFTNECSESVRSYDGTCNNRRNRRWGAANTCYKRLLPANYADDEGEPVADAPHPMNFGSVLQSIKNDQRTSMLATNLIATFGQFLAHDVAATVGQKLKKGTCCEHRKLEKCSMAVDTEGDEFYTQRNITCTNFLRSAPCACQMGGPRIPMNSVTAYLDLSQVYGSSRESMELLRDQNNLHWFFMSQYNQLPLAESHICSSQNCFRAGDFRVNAVPTLSAEHTVWARNHNFIATKLKQINPAWKGSKVFEEARKLNIAQYQIIVYMQYLPLLVGYPTLRKHQIHITNNKYNPNTEAAVLTEFATAAYRYHAVLPDSIGAYPVIFFNNTDFFQLRHLTTKLMKAATSTAVLKNEFPLSRTVYHHMYDKSYDRSGSSWGLSMLVLSILRGRDHGLQPYHKYVELVTGRKIETFEDLISPEVMCEENVEILKKIYSNVHQVDLYVGGVLETTQSTILGRTWGDICARQFKALADGDRFFGSRAGFTEEQWNNILKTTSYGRILCFTTGRKYARNPFLIHKGVEDCNKYQLDWNLWKV